MRLVDSHCHLDNEKFADDFDAMIERARGVGVEYMLSIGTGNGPPDLECAIRIADRMPDVFATIGVHPHDAAKADQQTWDHLAQLVHHRKVVAFGEIGLDYHYDFSPRAVQQEVFVRQLQLASETKLPVIIHTREAWDDTFALLEEHWKGEGIMHCFTGGVREAERSLELGFHLSFGGVVTFPKAEELRDAAKLVPNNRLLVETDAPYLAPVPHRGKRNEPSFLADTVRTLATVRDDTPENIAKITFDNFRHLCLHAVELNGYTEDSPWK